MSRLKPQKLHIRFLSGSTPVGPIVPRRFTLTHSDRTGDLFLTIGQDYDESQVSGWYTRWMRDQAFAEWQVEAEEPEDWDEPGTKIGRQVEQETKTEKYVLHVHVHVSGGFVFGSPRWRNKMLKREIPLVLEAIRYGDRYLIEKFPHLGESAVYVHFESKKEKYRRIEPYGIFNEYKVNPTTPNSKRRR